MNIAFLSDIHGNYKVFKRAISELEASHIDRIYYLGDYLNYFKDGDKCLDLIIKTQTGCIKGNHEQILLDIIDGKTKLHNFKNKYNDSVKITLRKLKSRHIDFLRKLKNKKIIKIKNKSFLLAHGSPWDPKFYCYPNKKKIWEHKIKQYKQNVIILGHTHFKMKLKYKNKLVLNPGSIGQPRDGSDYGSWLEYKTNTNRFSFKKIFYLK